MSKDKLTFIDLFAGCGGLSEGFLQSNKYHGIAHVEWEIPMVRTLRKRLTSEWKHSGDESLRGVVHFDIQNTDELINGNWSKRNEELYGKTNHPEVIKHGLRGLVGGQNVDLVIGGPPCQAYSIAGRAQDKNGMKDDYRNYLFESFIKVVDAFRPKMFVFENVPGMLSASPGGKKVTERIYESFKEFGYVIKEPSKLKEVVQSASDFGVPQKRKRVIIVGIREDCISDTLNLDSVYSAINKEKTKEIKTVRDAIGHLPVFIPSTEPYRIEGRKSSHKPKDKDFEFDDNLWPRFHSERDINIFKEWVEKKMNSFGSKEKIEFYNERMGKSSNHGKYRNLEWNKPSQTIVAHLYKDGLLFIHPDPIQSRSISVKEAALLQSFPNNFSFSESMGHNYKMIGNAVPPLMAKHIALAIAKELN
ncbi:DNA cytosine methyltransferase [Bacteroidia bacterium]|nr:DNA cytosine methyltransferase [Bacteroidia bacterium]